MEKISRAQKGKSVCKKAKQDWKCIVCGDWYSRSAPGEDWIQCLLCLEWAHFECANREAMFQCEKCKRSDE